jgi:hypothetical protein
MFRAEDGGGILLETLVHTTSQPEGRHRQYCVKRTHDESPHDARLPAPSLLTSSEQGQPPREQPR